METFVYLLTAALAAVLIVRGAPGRSEQISATPRLLAFALFGVMVYAGASKGIEALREEQIRLFSRAGSGEVVRDTEPLFWIQLLMCWSALVLGLTVSMIVALAPRRNLRGG